MFQFAGIEIPEAGAAETESTDPAVPLRVIDIGCGTGGTMRWLSEHFPDWQISGLDKNPDVHEPGWIETGCAEKLPYPDQTADIILMECSCSKAAEPAAALREVYRVLKPEGWLLMSDMYARKKELFLDGMLGRLESAKTIRDRLAEAGFVLAKMQDASGTLAEWIGQQIFDGNLEFVCAALGAERKILKEAGCGYFIAAAQPSGLWRTLSYVKEKSPFYQKKFTSVWGQLGKMAGSDVRLAPDSFSWADFRAWVEWTAWLCRADGPEGRNPPLPRSGKRKSARSAKRNRETLLNGLFAFCLRQAHPARSLCCLGTLRSARHRPSSVKNKNPH